MGERPWPSSWEFPFLKIFIAKVIYTFNVSEKMLNFDISKLFFIIIWLRNCMSEKRLLELCYTYIEILKLVKKQC